MDIEMPGADGIAATAALKSISVDTVRSHIRKVYRKLQVHSAPEAVARAIRERMPHRR